MSIEPVKFIDFEELRRQVSGYDTLFIHLLQLLLEQAPLWVEELDHAFAGGDSDLVRKVCHKIKGSAGTLQARFITEAAAELNAHAVRGDLSAAGESRERVVRMINDTVAFVRNSGHI